MVKKGKPLLYGSESDAINRFGDIAESLRVSGGSFQCHFDESMRINEVVLQLPSMAEYGAAYNRLIRKLDQTLNV